MSYAFRCEVCDTEPLWGLLRHGDAMSTWACAEHLSDVLLRAQRDSEITKVTVTHFPKAREWADLGRALEYIATDDDGAPA